MHQPRAKGSLLGLTLSSPEYFQEPLFRFTVVFGVSEQHEVPILEIILLPRLRGVLRKTVPLVVFDKFVPCAVIFFGILVLVVMCPRG